MKRYFLIIIVSFVHFYLAAQHKNIEEIKHYYRSIDKNKLIDILIEENKELYSESYELFNISVDSIMQNKNEDLENLRSDNSNIILVPKMKNAKNYSFDKNIYDFLCVDTANTQIRYYNMQKEEETILTHERLETFTHSGKSLRDFRNMINVIKKEKPEVILIASWIFQNKSNDNINYLFIKGDIIYVYRSKYKDMYELNQFVREFFKEKEFKKWAILNEKGYRLVG
jgi:hypothetical protein